MLERMIIDRRYRKWVSIFLWWTMLALILTLQIGINQIHNGIAFRWWQILRGELTYCYLWFFTTPLVILIDRCMRMVTKRLWQIMAVHVFAASAFSVIHTTIYSIIVEVMGWALIRRTLSERVKAILAGYFHVDLLFYGGVLGVYYFFNYYRESRERAVRESQLEGKLAQAELQNLKMQLHPHFLFNTLNTISVLMSKDVVVANRMLIQLSSLLRSALENVGIQEAPLKRELEFLDQYLEIEQVRFQDRLSVQMDVDPSLYDVLIPNLILQPLVENAIHHGIAPRMMPGVVKICATRDNGKVHLSVQDDGPGINGQRVDVGVGLGNTRARLAQLYGEDHHFDMRNMVGGGLRVTITLPCKNEEDSCSDRR